MSATEIEALMLRMEVNLRGYERQLARARKTTDEAMKRVEETTRDTARRVEKSMDDVRFGGLTTAARGAMAALGPLGGALSGLVSAEALRRAIDGYTRTINALKVAGLEGENLRQTYEDLFAIANRQGAPIEELSRLFGQLTQAQRDLGVSSQTIKTLVEATGQALRVSGVPASQAAGAILGLSQSLSGGTVRAEEFNQMLEGGLRPALQAAANGLREAEGSVGKLRQIIVEGELSSKDFARAIEAGQQGLAELASRADETSAQALNRLNNALFDAAGKLNEATGASRGMAAAMGGLADAVSAAAARIPALASALREIVALGGNALGVLNSIGRAASGANYAPRTQTGIADLRDRLQQIEGDLSAGRARSRDVRAFDALNSSRINQAQDLRNRIALAESLFDSVSEVDREANRAAGFPRIAASTRVQNPVSKNDNPPDGKSKGGGGGGGGGGSAASAYERELEALNKRTAALKLDIETFGQSAEAISKAKVEQQLLNALQEDGKAITEAQRAKVAELAGAFSETEARLKSMKDAQEAFNELQTFIGNNLSSFFSDVVAGGKSAERALEGLVKRLADAALKAVLLGDGPLAGLFGTAPTGGAKVGGLIGALFGGFRARGGPVQGGRAYVVGERGPELMVPGQSGFVVPNNALRRGGMGGSSTYAPTYNIDARGADAAAVARLERSLAERDRTESARIAAANRQRDVRGMRP